MLFVDLEKAFDRFQREVDGFRCNRCDGTIQKADIAEDLVVDGEI